MTSSTAILLWSLAFGVTAFVIVAGNSLTVAAFFTSNKLMRMRASYFLVSLAAADMLIGVITIPMYIAFLNFHLQNKLYHDVYTAIDIASGFASVFTLTAISVERLYAFWYPLHYRATNTPRTYLRLVGAIWMLSGIITTLHILFRYKYISYSHFFFVMMASLSVSLLVMCLAYLGIFFKVKLHYRQNQRPQQHERRFAYMLFTITTLFVFTWLPFHLLNIINYFCGLCFANRLPHQLLFACKLLHYANSFVNPFIYSYQMPEFKKTLLKLLCKESRAAEETRKIEEAPLENEHDKQAETTML